MQPVGFSEPTCLLGRYELFDMLLVLVDLFYIHNVDIRLTELRFCVNLAMRYSSFNF